MGSLVKTILFLVVSVFLTRLIPFNDFFRNVDTMIHEFGHALVTLILSGKVMFIELYANHSGITYSQVSKEWSLVPISLAGYTTASLFTLFLFYMRARNKERLGLQMITLIAIASLALFVRNQDGIVWLIGFILLNTVMLAFVPRWLRDTYYVLLAFLTLEESVVGPFSLILYAWEDSSKAGDATNLAHFTPFGAMVWSVVFTVFALWCAMQALRLFVASRRAAGPRHGSVQLPMNSRMDD